MNNTNVNLDLNFKKDIEEFSQFIYANINKKMHKKIREPQIEIISQANTEFELSFLEKEKEKGKLTAQQIERHNYLKNITYLQKPRHYNNVIYIPKSILIDGDNFDCLLPQIAKEFVNHVRFNTQQNTTNKITKTLEQTKIDANVNLFFSNMTCPILEEICSNSTYEAISNNAHLAITKMETANIEKIRTLHEKIMSIPEKEFLNIINMYDNSNHPIIMKPKNIEITNKLQNNFQDFRLYISSILFPADDLGCQKMWKLSAVSMHQPPIYDKARMKKQIFEWYINWKNKETKSKKEELNESQINVAFASAINDIQNSWPKLLNISSKEINSKYILPIKSELESMNINSNENKKLRNSYFKQILRLKRENSYEIQDELTKPTQYVKFSRMLSNIFYF